MADGTRQMDLVVVGGGIAGLAAASFAAGGGLRVLLLERSASVGGMARSTEYQGFLLNMGPRALYPPASRILDELGVQYTGGRPVLNGYALVDDLLIPIPRGVDGLIESSPQGFEGPAIANVLDALARTESHKIEHLSLAQWATQQGLDGWTRQVLYALVRLASYIDAPESLAAGTARTQLVETMGDVLYLDGGWQTLVEGLVQVAKANGVEVESRARVLGLERSSSGIKAVRLADGRSIPTPNVVLAVSPQAASSIMASVGAHLPATTPVGVATLDLALKRLPNPDGSFVVPLSRPLYFSVHSLSARLAPGPGAVIHTARYLRPNEHTAPEQLLEEIEWLVDQVQPGWREMVIHKKYLPDMTVTHALPTASMGGLSGRPGTIVAGLPGAFLAGDWVGDQHLLAAAALGSAKHAASLAVARLASISAASEV